MLRVMQRSFLVDVGGHQLRRRGARLPDQRQNARELRAAARRPTFPGRSTRPCAPGALRLRVSAAHEDAPALWAEDEMNPFAVFWGDARDLLDDAEASSTAMVSGVPAPSMARICSVEAATTGAVFVFELPIGGTCRCGLMPRRCYLAAAARMLGDWWTDDRVSFTEIAAATGRIFRAAAWHEHPPAPRPTPARRDGDLRLGAGRKTHARHSLDGRTALVEALHRDCPHAATVVCGQDIEDIRPHLSAVGVDAVADRIDEARECISALWDREMARQAASPANECGCHSRRS